MADVLIVINEFDERLSKRQPWYSIKKILIDLKEIGAQAKVVKDFSCIPREYNGIVIKVFSLKDVLLKRDKSARYKLVYLMTFPVYSFKKIFNLPKKTIIENFQDIKRVILFAFLPKSIWVNTLKQADMVVTISDRSSEFIGQYVKTQKYYPFLSGNWGENNSSCKIKSDKVVVGYLGPPYTTRFFDEVIDFFKWLGRLDCSIKKKVITRIERDELKNIEQKYFSKLENDKNTELISGFLDRNELKEELSEIDVLILPFRMVMSELPIVVLEALELGLSVITTEECGIKMLASDLDNILILDGFGKGYYEESLSFIRQRRNGSFKEIKNQIEKGNSRTLGKLCQR
jgi:glycosyltransferase involved in cell wall biosynthesis